ncbi:unnamed protein product [Discosporangium mesarthrocarpum]
MHPDKLRQRGETPTDEHKARFQRMKDAYDVLADPQKRELYDQLGETGMKVMEGGSDGLRHIWDNFLKMRTRQRLKLVLFVLAFVGAVLLFPILFCRKVDQDTSASWAAIWTPLWLFDAVGLWFCAYNISLGKNEPPPEMEMEWEDPYPMRQRVLDLVKWILLFVFQIFLTLRLDERNTWSYTNVCVPLFLWLVLRLMSHTHEAVKPLPAEDDSNERLDEEAGELPDREIKRVKAILLRDAAREDAVLDCVELLQLGLIVLKVDDKIGWSWWLVFFPVWVYLFGKLSAVMLAFKKASALSQEFKDKDPDDLTPEEQTKAGEANFGASAGCCCWSFTFTTVLLAVFAITGADFSAFVIFIPSFMVAGCIVCCLSCFICCVRELDEMAPENDPEHFTVEGASDVPPHLPQSYGTYTPPSVEVKTEANKEEKPTPVPAPAPAPAAATILAPIPVPSRTESTHIDVGID